MSVAPPYSTVFARGMLVLFHRCIIGRMKPHGVSLLREFAHGCENLAFLPPLNQKDLDLLAELPRPGV
jgi:hypothetical protein